jgi:hypothetical protein
MIKNPNIDKYVTRYRTGACGGLIATIPNKNVSQAKKTFGKGFPRSSYPREDSKETDFKFKTNSTGYEKLWRSMKKPVDY